MCVMISVRGSALVSSMVREMSDCPSVKQITRIPAILGGKLCNRSLGYCAIFLLYLGFVFYLGPLSVDMRLWVCC